MARLTLRWCLVAACVGSGAAFTAGAACSASDPIVFSDRVPYEWEVWEMEAGIGVDAATAASDAAAGSDATAAASPPLGLPPLSERSVFPPDNFWNRDISTAPLDPMGPKWLESMGLDKPLKADWSAPDLTAGKPGYGIPYQYVPGNARKVPVEFHWSAESDPGPYPIPENPLIERGSDHHILMIDVDNWLLYELWDAKQDGARWKAGTGAIFDLKSNKTRPQGWTSADAAGLAVFPGLVRADEVLEKKAIKHALRFTAAVTQRAYVYPASHFASDKKDPKLPPMGMWCRLRANFNIDGFSPNMQVILKALKKYGMILADNGSDYFVSGAPDPRWIGEEMKQLERVKGRDLEVIKSGDLVTQ
jgi:hypothetical protein